MNPTIDIPKTSLLGTPAGELVLTILGGEHDGRILRLTAAKCLIGSAAGCTLRLRARGIRPVHVLILRGPAGSIVRCWSPDAQLNHRSFTESALNAGDTLQIGPIQLVVSELPQPISASHSAFETRDEPAVPSRPTRPARRHRRKQLFDYLRQEREQQLNLQATIADQREQLTALEQQPVPAQTRQPDDCLNQQLAKTVEQLRQELDAAAKRRALEQHSAARQRAAWEELAAQRLQAELINLTAELASKSDKQVAAERQAATIVHDQLRAELASLSQQRQSLTREIDSLKLSLETKIKSEELSRQSAASQIEQLSHAFDLVRQERDELFQRLHADQQLLDEQTALARTQLDEARRSSQAQLMDAKTTAQTQIAQLREEFSAREQQWSEELIARTVTEERRQSNDARLIEQLTSELQSLRAEVALASSAQQHQQDGFTQARKRLEAEIASLNTRVQQSEQALHEARENSGQLQTAVLAEAEQARSERDAVRAQMLRQQQDWTEFRSRLEAAATEDRKLACDRYETLQSELTARSEELALSTDECESLQKELARLKAELEQGQQSLLAADCSANHRLQGLQAELDRREQSEADLRSAGQLLQEQLATLQSELQQQQATQLASEEVAKNRLQELEGELATSVQEQTRTQSESQALQQQLSQLRIELEQSQEALFAAEHGANNRLQQMTVSMEQLQVDRGGAEAELEQARADWDRERNSLAQCVAELQLQVTQLTDSLSELEQQARTSTSETLDQVESTQQQLRTAQEQLDHWQSTAQAGKQRCEELLQSVASFQQQEQAWQQEREQLDVAQQQSTDRLQQLETAISDLQQQLIAAQQAAAVSTESAVPSGPQPSLQPSGEFAGGTININNQDLAALQEQMHEPVPSLLAPRDFAPVETSAALRAREAELQAQSEGLLLQQGQLEEQQAMVARQRIELEQFQASLLELQQSLERKALELQPKAADSLQSSVAAAHDDYHDSSYGDDPQRESNPLSESEAFASMADQVAALYHPPASPAEPAEFSYDSPATFSSPAEYNEATVQAPGETNTLSDESHEPDDEFDRQLDARIARVMRREKSNWEPAAATGDRSESNFADATNDSPAAIPGPDLEEAVPTKSNAVSNVLDRLREAGLWKGEGTAQANQLPSSNHAVDAVGTGFCRASQEGPIVGDVADEQASTSATDAESESEADLSPLTKSPTSSSGLLNPPKADDASADDSIESYMSRLMQRLRPGSDVESSPQKGVGKAVNRASNAAVPVLTPPPPKPTDSKPLTSLTELAPRSPAPELSSNLAAMRELANSAARGAIESHHQRRGQKRVTAQTINTVLAVLVATGLMFYWYRSGSWPALGGVALSLLIAVGSSLVAALQTAALRKAGRTSENRSDAN